MLRIILWSLFALFSVSFILFTALLKSAMRGDCTCDHQEPYPSKADLKAMVEAHRDH
jgi:hypothetical protein